MSDEQQEFKPCWAAVEIFGHQRFSGQITEQSIAGDKMVRLDIPAVPEVRKPGALSRFHPATGERAPAGQVWRYTTVSAPAEAYTKLFGVKAIYAITPTPEAVVRAALEAEHRSRVQRTEDVECVPDPAIPMIAAGDKSGADAENVDFDDDLFGDDSGDDEDDDLDPDDEDDDA